jgi:hypothetical protein
MSTCFRVEVEVVRPSVNIHATPLCGLAEVSIWMIKEAPNCDVSILTPRLRVNATSIFPYLNILTKNVARHLNISCGVICPVDVLLYEIFRCSDGYFILADGGSFYVLREKTSENHK